MELIVVGWVRVVVSVAVAFHADDLAGDRDALMSRETAYTTEGCRSPSVLLSTGYV
ncbi:hypothetical protein [Pseudonocardia endophytica]|uniref:hypothetical protein n=1 Tax=Pseudonocardia endophytica TaxID=401976 RepID=UPI0014042EF7|nr:hypothetical protein [Pseudonocardia endophytica]